MHHEGNIHDGVSQCAGPEPRRVLPDQVAREEASVRASGDSHPRLIDEPCVTGHNVAWNWQDSTHCCARL